MWVEHTNGIVEAGLLLRNVLFFAGTDAEGGFASFPYSIILTQACDIASYYKNRGKKDDDGRVSRQIIRQLILCPTFDEEKFKSGDHLKEQYEYQTEKLFSGEIKAIREGRRERYHYLHSDMEMLPNLIIDFKQYFSVPIEVVERTLKDAKKSYKLDHIFHTDLADRFAHYVQRVAFLD